MLFTAVNKHDSKECPLKTGEGVKMLKEIFSDKNLKKRNIDLLDAYISCPLEKHSTHTGVFIFRAESKYNVKSLFRSLDVEVKEVAPFNIENI
ncbi:hypothetical protein [Methanobacterium sp. MBAC-LM]|uniref:hypothetical protein n=1 Tax=Methanobacterium sp. MBAC-LM TaxID=3412034 RepID=UPI003C75DC69